MLAPNLLTKLVEQGLASPKSTLLMLKIFHKKHKFTSKTTFANVNSFNCGDTSNYSSVRIRRETLTCEICGHVEIIDRPAIKFHQGNITEPIGTITTKKT